MTLLALFLSLLQPALPGSAPGGEAILRAVYAKYARTWPRTITYLQQTEELGTQRPQTWYIAMQLPGKLRVDIAPMGVGRALITRDDSTFGFGGGRLTSVSTTPNPMLLLLHDIHVQAPEITIKTVKGLGFDVARSHEDVWAGRPMLVVGAAKGDSVSNQIWFDKERLVMVRMLYNRRQFEARVAGFRNVKGAWIEGGVEIWNKGQLVRTELYDSIKTGVKLEPGLFDAKSYSVPKWVGPLNDIYGKVPPVPGRMLKGRGGG